MNEGGNRKNANKTSETIRRTQADMKSAALHLQSQQTAEQYDNTDESATLTLTEDEINEESSKLADCSMDLDSWVRGVVIFGCLLHYTDRKFVFIARGERSIKSNTIDIVW